MPKAIYVLFILFSLLFITNKASADTIIPIDDISNTYDIELNNIEFLVLEDSIDLLGNTGLDDLNIQLEESEDNINNIGDLNIKQAFSKVYEPTFADTKKITGSASEGTEVILYVYYKENKENEEEEIKIDYQNLTVVGAAELYNETIPLNYIGKNYILIIVKSKDTITARIYLINKKNNETKKALQSKYINLFDEVTIPRENDELLDLKINEFLGQ